MTKPERNILNYGTSTFPYVLKGPTNYFKGNFDLSNSRFRNLNPEGLAALANETYFEREPNDHRFFRSFREVMRSHWIWVPTRNAWTVSGVHILSERYAKSQTLDTDEIINSSFSQFVPQSELTLGENSPDQLIRNGFVNLTYGREGTRLLAELASRFKLCPLVCGVERANGERPIATVSALDDYFGWRLRISGYDLPDSHSGYTVGIVNAA